MKRTSRFLSIAITLLIVITGCTESPVLEKESPKYSTPVEIKDLVDDLSASFNEINTLPVDKAYKSIKTERIEYVYDGKTYYNTEIRETENKVRKPVINRYEYNDHVLETITVNKTPSPEVTYKLDGNPVDEKDKLATEILDSWKNSKIENFSVFNKIDTCKNDSKDYRIDVTVTVPVDKLDIVSEGFAEITMPDGKTTRIEVKVNEGKSWDDVTDLIPEDDKVPLPKGIFTIKVNGHEVPYEMDGVSKDTIRTMQDLVIELYWFVGVMD